MSIDVDASWTVSHSQTVNLTPTKIVNGSTSDVLQVAFIPQQQSSSDFQPLVQGVLQIDDDGQGIRSKTDNNARKIALELRVIILPKEQVKKIHHLARKEKHEGIAGDGPYFYYDDIYEDRLEQAYHEFARVIHIPLPPVPKT